MMTPHPGRYCRTDPDGLVHHGWDCEEADPLADVLAALVTEPLANPLLEASRQSMLARWLGPSTRP